MHKRIAFLTALIFAVTVFTSAQEKSKPSPPAAASCQIGGANIQTNYSSPRAKGRKIYGGLVPFGEVWRAGANEATTFVTSANVTVGGTAVPAGSYTLFALPTADKWTLILSKKTGEWGIPYPDGQDFARVEMKVSALPAAVENFTIAYDKTGSGCTLRLDWETTRASVDITAK